MILQPCPQVFLGSVSCQWRDGRIHVDELEVLVESPDDVQRVVGQQSILSFTFTKSLFGTFTLDHVSQPHGHHFQKLPLFVQEGALARRRKLVEIAHLDRSHHGPVKDQVLGHPGHARFDISGREDPIVKCDVPHGAFRKLKRRWE